MKRGWRSLGSRAGAGSVVLMTAVLGFTAPAAPAHANDTLNDRGMVTAAPWGSVAPPQATYRSRRQGAITGLTVHHQGETWQAGADVPA